ncbi:MAG TPA: ABC transporter permease subunit [Syntrophomonadaceae bacterium]|nr:ABC transporter permease subunit [Syntrophomonadaceae bacterium]
MCSSGIQGITQSITVNSIFNRNYPVIQGYVLFMAMIFVVANLIVDISYGLLDPRIRLKKRS